MEYAPEYPLASKVHYRPIDAAIRWADLLQHEEQIVAAYQKDDIAAIAENTYWPRLNLKLELILDALRHRELPFGLNGYPAAADTSVEDPNLTIRHVHLKAWMERYYPCDRPAFLFSALERSAQFTLTLESMQALLHQHEMRTGAIGRDLEIMALRVELGKLLSERADAVTRPSAPDETLSKRGEMVYLHIIGGMLEVIFGRDGSGRSNSRFRTQGDLIAALTEQFGERLGITRSTLENKFASANRILLGHQ